MADVPGKFDISIDGVGFMLFEEGEQPALMHQSIRQQREQSGGANANIGEQTINPEGFWRRSRDGWYHGAGQTYGDREESDPLRFRASQGVDVFSTRHQATLLHSVDQATTFTGVPMLLSANGRVYLSGGSGLVFTSAPLTLPWTTTTVTGTPTSVEGLAVLGDTLFVAGAAQGVYSGSTGGSSVSSYATGSADGIAAAKGRLMVWNGNVVYNIVAAGAFPSPLVTFSSGVVVGIVGAGNHIYIALFGDPSVIYKTTIKPDGTALDVPSVAVELPAGETLVSFDAGSAIFAYLNRVFVLTNRGIRMGVLDADGNIEFGSIIPTDGVTNNGAWAAYDRFVWCGASDPLSTSSTIRLDLLSNSLPNTPVYANDLHTGNIVEALAVHNGRLILADTDDKVYVESDNYVDSGYIDSGLLALDIADKKGPVSIDVEGGFPDDTEITEEISIDRGATFTEVGTVDDTDDAELPITGVAASRQFELRTTLTASADNESTPVLYRHTLKAEPNVNQSDYIIARLRLFESVVDNTTGIHRQKPKTLRAGLRALQQSREVVPLVEGDSSYTVTVRDMDDEYLTRCAPDEGGDWNSVATVRMKVITSA